MIRYEDECVGCSSLGLPCMGSCCPNRNVPHLYCDKCDEEFEEEELFTSGDDMICLDCLLEMTGYKRLK